MSNYQTHNQPAAESSRAAEIRAQTKNHPFLQFTNSYHHARYMVLKERDIKTTNGIDWEQIPKIDPCNRLASLLPIDTPWRRFFDILEPSYDELVYEFWSTVNITPTINLTYPGIYFRLAGKEIHMSLTEFALRLGIYTENEVSSPIFTEAATYISTRTTDYWNTHSLKNWCLNNYSYHYKDPLHQYMHLVIANSIRERSTNLQRVSLTDLCLLHSIFESVPCNIAYFLAMNFEYYKPNKYPKNLFGGSYITRLAKSLDILTNQVILGLSPPRQPEFISVEWTRINYVPIQPHNASFLRNTTPQNLQQELMQFPPSSFYRHDLLTQSTTGVEHVSIDTPQPPDNQPQTPSFYQSLSPLLSEQEILSSSLFEEDMLFQDIKTNLPLSPLWQQPTLPQSTDDQEQPPPSNEEVGPSTVSPVNPPLDQERIDSTRAIEQVRRMSLQIERLEQRSRWQEEVIRQLANTLFIQVPSPPPFIEIHSGSESDPEPVKD